MEIQVKNIHYFECLPFDQYLQLPGHSCSSLKNEGKIFEPTARMNLGSAVDDYLNEPDRFSGDLNIVKPLAWQLKSRVGKLYPKFKKQLSITAEWHYMGMVMLWKGRMDWAIPNMIVVDIKISENIWGSIKFFEYFKQLSGYAIALNTKNAIILSANPKTNKVNEPIPVPVETNWWKRKIMEYGRAGE